MHPTAPDALYGRADRNWSLDRSICLEFRLRDNARRRPFRSTIRDNGIGRRRMRGSRHIGEGKSRRDQHSQQANWKHGDFLSIRVSARTPVADHKWK
jgi:hypothetical protein